MPQCSGQVKGFFHSSSWPVLFMSKVLALRPCLGDTPVTMKIALLALLLVLPVGLYAQDRKQVAKHLQSISVTVKAGRSEGSGVIIVRKIGTENKVFILTAGHVVDGLRKTREIIDPKTGTKRTLVEFDDAAIVSEFIQKGRAVGESKLTAEIISYSDADDGHDVAVLMVRKAVSEGQESAKFYLEDEIPYAGMNLLHVGSLLGQTGSNSFTDGVMSQIGRIIGKMEYDQTTVTAFPGSSGGGVFNEKGEYVGELVRGAGETFSLFVPIRRIKEWAKESKMEWLLDSTKPAPKSLKEVEEMEIECCGIELDDKGKKVFSRPNFKSRFQYIEDGERFNHFLIKLLPSTQE